MSWELIQQLIFSDPHTSASISFPVAVEYIAVIVGACFGAALAFDKKLDIIGAIILGLITGFGGGIIRDTLIPGASVYFLNTPNAVLLSTLAAIMVYYFRSIFTHFSSTMLWADTIALALFAILGAEKGLIYNYNPIACILLGAITAVGGGLLRDIFMGETPQLFKQSNFYGICGLLGAAIYIFGCELWIIKPISAALSAVGSIGLRWLSIHYNWRTHEPFDYSHKLLKPIKRILRYTDGVQEVKSHVSDEKIKQKVQPAELIVIDKDQVLVVHEIHARSPQTNTSSQS